MKQNILITWVSSWIWHFLAENMRFDFEIFWISRRNPNLENINFSSVDLTDFKSLNLYIDIIKDKKLDAIILNAWVGFFDKIENIRDEEIIKTINLNLTSNIIFVKNILPYLHDKAKIIFIWSVAWKKFFKYWSVYQASKFGLRWFAWSLRNEIKQSVFLINPWFVDTEFFENERLEIQIKWWYKETKIETILEIIKNILSSTEKRFEIDL